MVLYISGKAEADALEGALALFIFHADTEEKEAMAAKILARVIKYRMLQDQGKEKAATPKDSD